MKETIHWTLRAARRAVVAVLGGSLVALGLVLVFLPGPALLVIPAGLAILALEFGWARRWLRRLNAQVEGGAGDGPEGVRKRPAPRAADDDS